MLLGSCCSHSSYMKASPRKGNLYKKHSYIIVEAYLDVDYTSDADDQKSILGFCI